MEHKHRDLQKWGWADLKRWAPTWVARLSWLLIFAQVVVSSFVWLCTEWILIKILCPSKQNCNSKNPNVTLASGTEWELVLLKLRGGLQCLEPIIL